MVTEKEWREQERLVQEIMNLLIKRQTSLADGIDTLTGVKLNVLKVNYGGARANEFDLLSSHFYEEVRRFSGSMKSDRFCLIPRKGFSVDATHVLMKRDRVSRLHSVKWLWHRIEQALARAGTNLRNKLGHGGDLQGTTVDKERPERVRHLAIEIGELLNKLRTSRTTLGDIVNALDTVNVTAIEATHGRERADEFDLLVARFTKEATAMLKSP